MDRNIKIVFIGDIVGNAGRKVVFNMVPDLSNSFHPDLIIANAENAAGGFGITPQICEELFKSRIDIITSGNHIWDKKEIVNYIEGQDRLLRPANYPPGVPGRGYTVVETASGEKIGILNLSGRVFMDSLDCPFQSSIRHIEKLSVETKVIIVDIHAEATSEKIALAWFLDGKVSAVIGTHTHVQTADNRILPKGTGYITDVGMTGATDSVIGIKKDIAIERFLKQMPKKFEMSEDDVKLSGVILEITPQDGRCNDISRFQVGINEKVDQFVLKKN